jgi:ribosomal protein S27AE
MAKKDSNAEAKEKIEQLIKALNEKQELAPDEAQALQQAIEALPDKEKSLERSCPACGRKGKFAAHRVKIETAPATYGRPAKYIWLLKLVCPHCNFGSYMLPHEASPETKAQA